MRHLFQLKNNTDLVWTIEYEINDPKGVFGNRIELKGNGKKQVIDFEEGKIQFTLNQKEMVTLFNRSYTNYDMYKKNTVYNDSIREWGFINIDTLMIASEEKVFKLDPTALENYMDENSWRRARIPISKVVEQLEKTIP
ncbi:MAG: hypothetical protein AAGA77_12150 [Bacteroidota bacterium]